MTRAQLTDEEWAFIEPYLPIGEYGPYPERLRQQFEGVIWRFKTGGQWREVPQEFGAWSTVSNRFRQWRDAGLAFGSLLRGRLERPEAELNPRRLRLQGHRDLILRRGADCLEGTVGLRELITDVWSWLDYKPALADPRRPGRNTWAELTRSWVPDEDLRRLAAYRHLAAYDSNQAGQVAAVTGDDEAGIERRELGDASKLVDTALGYLLGSEQVISVAGAEHTDDEPTAEAAAALAVQNKLRAWAEKELLPLRLQQAERTAILLGDAVYTLAWDPGKGRVLLRTWDPGLYFPEWAEDGEQDGAEFPLRVHLAWELPEDKRRGLKARLRRVTYELGPIGPASRRGAAKDGSPSREYLYTDSGASILVTGDALNADTGLITRTYPWAPNRPSSWTCYLTDAEWDLDDLKHADLLYDLPMHRARYRVRSDGEVLDRLDLMADFIPVVHITNSIPVSGEHWGKPTVATVLQALDELSATDTDGSGASATTGSPIIGLAGARLPIDRATGQPLLGPR